jgi:hypothetical protein
MGGWVGPIAVLDVVVKRKIPSPRRESNPRTPIVQPVANRYKGHKENKGGKEVKKKLKQRKKSPSKRPIM